ncbi:deoxyribose-phosphate aldolase [Salinarchaeum chitinilyticum]
MTDSASDPTDGRRNDPASVPDLPSRIDHTILGPTTTPDDVDRAAGTARRLGTNVCVPPCYVDRASETMHSGGADADAGAVVTVVGFPHGQYATATVVAEARAAAADGADELDAVVNAGRITAGESAAVREDIAAIVAATTLPVKAIVCAPLLDRDELELACEIAVDAGCSHVKTATGFNGGGATVEDVRVMADYLPVKASGGIGSWTEAAAMFEAGAVRIGASSGDAIVAEWREAIETSD